MNCCVCGEEALAGLDLCAAHREMQVAAQAMMFGDNPTPDGKPCPEWAEEEVTYA